jgi:[ribosomal protein S18]-alanine N-acetyltransferase
MSWREEIRRATAADADAIHALERSTPEAAHWSAAEYAQILAPADEDAALQRGLLLAEENGILLGFIALRLLRVEQEVQAEIENLAVATQARRQGIGSALCKAALRATAAAAIDLEVRAGNHAAIALYTGLGFVQTGLRPAYYAHPQEDAVLLRFLLQNQ